jgi:hypothetical protein
MGPDAVAFTPNGDMWVADPVNNRLQRLTSAGTWQQSITENGQVGNAWSVVTGYNGVDGNIGESGSAAGQFVTPPRIAIASR